MEVANGLEFVDRTLHFAQTLDASIATVFEGRELMLEQFWTLASSVERLISSPLPYNSVSAFVSQRWSLDQKIQQRR